MTALDDVFGAVTPPEVAEREGSSIDATWGNIDRTSASVNVNLEIGEYEAFVSLSTDEARAFLEEFADQLEEAEAFEEDTS